RSVAGPGSSRPGGAHLRPRATPAPGGDAPTRHRSRIMSVITWLRRIASRTRTKSAPPRERQPRSRWDRCRLWLDPLEDRLAPATSITVIPGLAGSGSLDSFLSPTDGTIITTDGGNSPGTVSTGALAAVNASVNISV